MNDETVVRNYSAMVYKIAFGYVKNRHDAEDVFSDTFLSYFKKKRNFESEEHRKAWLIRVTINCAKSFLKKRPPYSDINGLDFEAEEGNCTEKLEVWTAVGKLPEESRNLIYFFYYEDMTVKEIANIFNMNENTVKTKLSRARETLGGLLGQEVI